MVVLRPAPIHRGRCLEPGYSTFAGLRIWKPHKEKAHRKKAKGIVDRPVLWLRTSTHPALAVGHLTHPKASSETESTQCFIDITTVHCNLGVHGRTSVPHVPHLGLAPIRFGHRSRKSSHSFSPQVCWNVSTSTSSPNENQHNRLAIRLTLCN